MNEAEVVAQVSAEVDELVTASSGLDVVTEANIAAASEMLVRAAHTTKSVEKWRKQLTKPLLDDKARIDAFFKELARPATMVETQLRTAITAYNTARERERQERERIARAELAKREKEREAERLRLAEAAGVEPEQMPALDLSSAVVIPELDTRIETESGSVSSRPVTKVIIEDPVAVPRAWCIPDVKAIETFCKEAVRMGGVETGRDVVRKEFGGAVRIEVELTTVVNT